MIETDALVIGAGPAGLFQVFQLGLLEIRCHVVDPLPEPGGQCAELYPDKPIYDLPGIPVCSGAELVANLRRQIAPFEPGWYLDQLVETLQRREDGRFDVVTSRGTRFDAGTVIVAAGVGAFVPRGLRLEGIAALEGRQVFYRAPAADRLAGFSGRHVVVLGDEDAALRTALQLSRAAGHASPDASGAPASVTLMHRRDVFRAAPMMVAQMRQAVDEGRLRLCIGQPQALILAPAGAADAAPCMTGLSVLDGEGRGLELAADVLLPLLGLSPKLGPIAGWGLAMEHKQITVDPTTCATSEPGIYAIGDINTYPHKKKLILAGFFEATMAAWAVHARLRPDEPRLLQYTTTSTALHKLLGVSPAE